MMVVNKKESEMDKLRLDYFLSVGGLIAVGDVIFNNECSVAVRTTGYCNQPAKGDENVFIKSFAPRKNDGVMPCDGELPVIGVHSAGECHHIARGIVWDANSGSRAIRTWKPDLAAIIKMQAEHDATLSKMETVESKPSVYTQEMADNSITPKVGMIFTVDNVFHSELIKRFNGLDVEVIGICRRDDNTIITFWHEACGVSCAIYRQAWVKPIDQRTPLEIAQGEQVKSLKAQIEEKQDELQSDFNLTELLEFMQENKMLDEVKLNKE